MDELYRSELMEIYKDPAHRGQLNDPSVDLEKHNPFCGDHLHLQLKIKNNKITDAKFSGEMCFVSIIGAEFLLEEIIGKSIIAARKIDQQKLLKILDLNLSTSRIACATLTLKALQESLEKYDK
jgi:nitrogen fixation protein NifU and related proteins